MLLGRDDDRTALHGGDHHLMLERRAALALTAEDYLTAFKYADRRCRVAPPPTSYCFVLRAQAAWRLGRQDAALDDLAEALEIDPADVSANRRVLAWAKGDFRLQAATRLIAHEQETAILRNAITVLHESGEQHWSAVSVLDSHVTGWVAWAPSGPVEAAVISEDARLTSLLEAAPFHSLATPAIKATGFRLHRPPSTGSQWLVLSGSGKTFLERRLAPNLGALRLFRPGASRSLGEKAPPTVIVPVFADHDATIACLESLLKAGPSSTRERPNTSNDAFRVLAVDDASPDPALRRYLKGLADGKRIDLLVNSQNLGFIGSINRALAEVSQGDVILLNADTLVPPGFVERLAAAAYSQADIGTATPLSNNGDIFSFPRPGYANPMPTYDEMVALDRGAATANARTVVDTPSGIGFCLYITRRCLDTVGGLSERFERGYLEDVDFCLRAREHGFRNVCASSVYVAHHGSKSFKQQKRGLVLRNLGVLDDRFPSFRKECLVFEAADPLRQVRANLERTQSRPVGSSVLIAAGPGAGLEIAQTRARQLAVNGERVILIVRDRTTLHAQAFDACPPQGTVLDLDQLDKSAEEVRRLRPSRLEIVDPHVSRRTLDLVRHLGVPIDLWITAEDSLAHVDAANRLLAPTQVAAAFLKARLPNCEPLVLPWDAPRLFIDGAATQANKVLAIIPSSPSARAWQTILSLATRFQSFNEQVQIVVAGATADDQTLLALPNVFITGRVEAQQLANLLSAVSPGFLLTDFEHPLFGDPMVETARTANRPVAFRDWSFGRLKSRNHDLAIPADASDAALADAVAQWIANA
jgi:GT2 family glycosyltransferase